MSLPSSQRGHGLRVQYSPFAGQSKDAHSEGDTMKGRVNPLSQ